MNKTTRQKLAIDELYINPDNYRYIESLDNEIEAIIAMFNKIPNKKYDKQMKEMMNLAYDISRDGLNPFEFPIVWYDEEIQKYIVIDGNRRITCIKLMLQYKNNEKISTNVPDVGKIYNIKPNIDMSQKIECIVYENLEEAKKVLSKIHQDSMME